VPEASDITAVLGPTNTGKTHRAIERMLDYDSGMIGLPLRLLAREVYDKITQKIGEAKVALVTGEEKRVPRRPSFWVCTVEAMPIEREVDFVAVDEIQLAAHSVRGHVFTDRLLRARGRRETWFMGAQTIRPLLAELVPTAKLVEHPRLSRLSYAGETTLAKVPPRSAVVAFSMPQVYELAERLRRLRGGAAVVLGALSPRTRNAQVAMFQAGEVDFLVATDAIGMGLNLDAAHVAFAATRKFDGHRLRDLDDAELAQIAGRAGRYVQDGTFGTVTPVALPSESVVAIEGHRFSPLQGVIWRSAELDFGSVDALVSSLAALPRSRILRPARGAEDLAALRHLTARTEVRALARGEPRVRLLWDVCGVPDFRSLLLEVHVAFLEELYLELAKPAGVLDDAWLSPRVDALDDIEGDVDALVARIAAVRTWTYVANHAGWVARADAWQERTRAIEDRLSDALHERLVRRFVDERAKAKPPRARPSPRASSNAREDLPIAASHPFAKLGALRDRLASRASEPAPSTGNWVDAIVDAPFQSFAFDARGTIAHEGGPIAALAPGRSIVLPEVLLLARAAELGAGARARLLRRLTAYARDVVGALLVPLRAAHAAIPSAVSRGLLYLLEQGLGTALIPDDLARELANEERAALKAAGVVAGTRLAYHGRLLAPRAVAVRATLASVHHLRVRRFVPAPPASRVSFVPERGVDPRVYLSIGFPIAGGRAVRADVLERIATAPATDVKTVASWLGCSGKDAARVIAETASATT
jgi:ATP-dependent RNA helicase SUPV3L1/SUV3